MLPSDSSPSSTSPSLTRGGRALNLIPEKGSVRQGGVGAGDSSAPEFRPQCGVSAEASHLYSCPGRLAINALDNWDIITLIFTSYFVDAPPRVKLFLKKGGIKRGLGRMGFVNRPHPSTQDPESFLIYVASTRGFPSARAASQTVNRLDPDSFTRRFGYPETQATWKETQWLHNTNTTAPSGPLYGNKKYEDRAFNSVLSFQMSRPAREALELDGELLFDRLVPVESIIDTRNGWFVHWARLM